MDEYKQAIQALPEPLARPLGQLQPKTARQVHDHIRGLHPWPVATMELSGKRFKVHAARVAPGSGRPGEILGLTKTGLLVACGQGAVEILKLQAEGGKPMAAPDYFRGHPLQA